MLFLSVLLGGLGWFAVVLGEFCGDFGWSAVVLGWFGVVCGNSVVHDVFVFEHSF